MILCTNCQRVRPKHDQHLIDQGLIECRPCENPGVVMRAFWVFAEHQECNEPFHVKGSRLHKEAAWPFQFHPDSIAQCSGYLAKAELAMEEKPL